MIRLLMLSVFWIQPGDTTEVRSCCMKPEATAAGQTVATTESSACPCPPGCCKDGWCSSCGDWCKNCCGDNCQCDGAKGAKMAQTVKATEEAKVVQSAKAKCCDCCGDDCKSCCGDNCAACCGAGKSGKAQG